MEAGNGNGLGEMKSGRLRELGWDTGYDTGCAFWSTPWVWGRTAWVERLDLVWESLVVWGIGREDPAPCLEFLFVVGREDQTSLVYWLWQPDYICCVA